MSMTGKTTNELFPVGQNTDTVSIFDLNVITEKADALIHELQGKDSLTSSELEEIKTKLTSLTQGLTTVTQTASTNASNIAGLQNSIDSLNKTLTNNTYGFLSKGQIALKTTSFGDITLSANEHKSVNSNISDISINDKVLGVVGFSSGNHHIVISKVECSPTERKVYLNIKNTINNNQVAKIRVTMLIINA